VLRIMESGAASGQKTWFIVDEMHSLQRLPQLATALAESRKAHCALVIGFQGRAQMVDLYGPLAETMLSQASTKLFFATSDPDAADWISRAIGEVEYLRHRISQSQGQQGRDSESQQREIVPEPLVRYSVIMGLEPLECYLKHGKYAVHFHTAYIAPEEKHPAFVKRDRTSVRVQMQALQSLPSSPSSEPAEPLAPANTTQQQHEFFE
jgi:type IV secretory pathway TraG/TraD family ATPase VirD4